MLVRIFPWLQDVQDDVNLFIGVSYKSSYKLVQYSAYPCKSTLFNNDNSCINIYLVKFPGDKTHIFNTMSHEGDSATPDTEFHLISAAAEARSCAVILF